MNPPQVYMCSPSWTLLPPPSPYQPSGLSQCTSPKHPVSCIEPALATHFIHDILHVSMPLNDIFSASPSSHHLLSNSGAVDKHCQDLISLFLLKEVYLSQKLVLWTSPWGVSIQSWWGVFSTDTQHLCHGNVVSLASRLTQGLPLFYYFFFNKKKI